MALGYQHYNITVVYPHHTAKIDSLNSDDFQWTKNPTQLGLYQCTTIKNKREVKADLIKRMKDLKIPSGMILFSSQLRY